MADWQLCLNTGLPRGTCPCGPCTQQRTAQRGWPATYAHVSTSHASPMTQVVSHQHVATHSAQAFGLPTSAPKAHPFAPMGVVAGMRRYDPQLQALCTALAQDGYEIIEVPDPLQDQTELRLRTTDAHGTPYESCYLLTRVALAADPDPEAFVRRALQMIRAHLDARIGAGMASALKVHLARLGVDAGL